MTALRLLRRASPFAFPGGNPGFDPSHPASWSGSQLGFSGVALGGGFVNLKSGKPFTKTGTPTSGLDGRIGPYVQGTGSTNLNLLAAAYTQASPWLGTLAAIAVWQASTGAVVLVGAGNSNGAGGISLEVTSGGVVQFLVNGVGSATLGITLTAGVPYFVAASYISPTQRVAVVVNLLTGQTQTSFAASIATQTAVGNLQIRIGDGGAATGCNSQVAAAMYSYQYMPLAALLQWAQDPWSFWYPNNFDLGLLVAAGAAPADILYPQAWF